MTIVKTLSVGTKVIAVIAACLAVLMTAHLIDLRSDTEHENYARIESEANAMLTDAEKNLEYLSGLHQSGKAFSTASNIAELQHQLDGAPPSERFDIIRRSVVYKTVPVVAAWTVARAHAKLDNNEFRTPRENPRNPENTPNEFERSMLRDLAASGQDELVRINEETNRMHVMRPVKLTQDCMICHGTTADYPQGNGSDPLGFDMEGKRAGDMHGAFEMVCDLAPAQARTAHMMQRAIYTQIAALILVIACLAYFVRRLVTRPLAKAEHVLHYVAAGDLTQRIGLTSEDEVGRMSRSLDTALDAIHDTLIKVRVAALSTSTASQELASSSEKLSEGAQSQASALAETVASLEEITATARQNAMSSENVRKLAEDSVHTADQGGGVVRDAMKAMTAVSETSKRISDIVTTIDDLAFQTNLLALNAAVEAARAGEQGRGFAVVASEVRSLAQRSATSAKEIKGLISETVARIDTGTALVTKSGESLDQIVDSVKKVTTLMGDIANASQEQSNGVSEINTATTQMDSVVQASTSRTEHLAMTARSMLSRSQELEQLVHRFKLVDASGSHPSLFGTKSTQPRSMSSPVPVAMTADASDFHGQQGDF